jgi:hypothetical protein
VVGGTVQRTLGVAVCCAGAGAQQGGERALGATVEST